MSDDVLKTDPFSKTQFAVRIDQLEAAIAHERNVSAQKSKQIQDMAEKFRRMSSHINKQSNVSEYEIKFFISSMIAVLNEKDRKVVQSISQNELRKAIGITLRGYIGKKWASEN